MPRKGLAKYVSKLQRFYAEVLEISSFQRKFADPVPTICLKNVRVDKAHTVTDHAWISPISMDQEEPFPLNIEIGTTIGFVATVAKYEKGPFRQKQDYGLCGIKYIEVISKGVEVCS